ncbi:uncharacterized protein [Miscanthus floridulus]|uniref:uncharacterized protein n=1 Tax=Miscanthus floridulus TaxID=154761 RepID=UPI00345913E5
MHNNVDENNEPHTNHEFRRYQAWYQRATRCRLRLQWTEDDYADIESSDDKDTAYDQYTRAESQMETGPILDRVDNTLKCSIKDIERFHLRVRDDDTRSFLDRLSHRLCRVIARCGCRINTTQDVYVPPAGRGDLGSSSQAAIGDEYEDEDDDDDDVDQRHEELGPSQL